MKAALFCQVWICLCSHSIAFFKFFWLELKRVLDTQRNHKAQLWTGYSAAGRHWGQLEMVGLQTRCQHANPSPIAPRRDFARTIARLFPSRSQHRGAEAAPLPPHAVPLLASSSESPLRTAPPAAGAGLSAAATRQGPWASPWGFSHISLCRTPTWKDKNCKFEAKSICQDPLIGWVCMRFPSGCVNIFICNF